MVHCSVARDDNGIDKNDDRVVIIMLMVVRMMVPITMMVITTTYYFKLKFRSTTQLMSPVTTITNH